MKRLFKIIIVLIVFLLIYTYLHHIPIPTKNLPTTVTIIALPSPPHYKTIIDTENIDLIFKMIKNSDLKPIINNEKGWQVSLEYRGGTIVMIGDKIEINGRWFKANNKISSKFMDFYLNLDYKEKLWK
ncbi:hypothetical protein QE109_02150 [Fusibacter bizertensis]|uniref:Uncharacterized protein n=1 Tax=Fusibacter bizertensis TaxID=1488331 RepID=A0ABT6N941_9FIRM|nr:hypothetical protein [Fusibacter bizertensis]MDH8676928.1 hypothetical protein [Fusibacter bizertensis]